MDNNERPATGADIISLFQLANAIDPSIDRGLGEALVDTGATTAAAIGVLRVMAQAARAARQPAVEIPEGVTWH